MAVENVIELSHIVKSFRVREGWRRSREFRAVDDVSLSIQRGELFGLLGRNGAGKTTLIKIMAGLLAADGGEGRVLGYDIHRQHKAVRASVSLVAPTADVGTDNNLTVRQNLEFWAVVYNVEPRQRQQRMDELLDFLGLTAYADFWPMSISAGMRQRLAIARSLLVRNPILFLDEPTVKLDATGGQAVRDFVRRINRQFGITVLLTTHLIFEAEELCDRVAILDRGRLVNCDSVANLRKHLQHYDACAIDCSPLPDGLGQSIAAQPGVVGCDFQPGGFTLSAENLEETLFATLKLLRGQGVSVYRVESQRPTLEDVFVSVTGMGE